MDAVDGIPVFLCVRRVLDLLLQLAQPAGDEAARAAGKVRHLFADPRLNHLRHEVGHGAGRWIDIGLYPISRYNRRIDAGYLHFCPINITFKWVMNKTPRKMYKTKRPPMYKSAVIKSYIS